MIQDLRLRETRPAGEPSRAETLLVLGLAALASGFVSLAAGQDANFDLANYHFYNGWALLSGGRLARDVAPGNLATFFNPVIDLLAYAGPRWAPPRLFGFALGALHGLNVFLVWAIARRVLGAGGRTLAAAAGLLAGMGQNALALLGTTFGDNLVTIPALAGLYALLASERPRGRAFLLAGLCGGAAAGLKLTMVGALGALGLVAVAATLPRRAVVNLALFAAGTAVGWGVIDGWWAFGLWQRFHNPLFPFANNLFHSPFLGASHLRDGRWQAADWLDWLRPPVDLALGDGERYQEVAFRDGRFLFVAVATAVALSVCLWRPKRRLALAGPAGRLILYWWSAYLSWLFAYYYYRYAAVVEFLAPVALLVLLRAAWPALGWRGGVAIAVIVLAGGGTRGWARQSWGSHWFNVRLPAFAQDPGQLVILEDPGSSFLAPYFPPDADFLGVFASGRWEEVMLERIARHRGPLRQLRRPTSKGLGATALGLRPAGECGLIRARVEGRFLLCPLQRSEGGPLSAAAP